MRIGILTLPLHTNYGGILQAYALQTVLERMGHQVRFIEPEKFPKDNWKEQVRNIISIVSYTLGLYSIVHRIHGETYVMLKNTQKFINKNIHIKGFPCIFSVKEDDFNAIIVGSDQVWRPMYFYKHPIELAYLSFTEGWNIRRIAYAVSFGSDEWEYNDDKTKLCTQAVSRFDSVSVREKSGVQLCREFLNVDTELVLDPTMLLTASDYNRLLDSRDTVNKSYILTYIIDSNDVKKHVVDKISSALGLHVHSSNSRAEDTSGHQYTLQEILQPPVESWLEGFRDASFVITDSFHACVFSIIYNKQFYVIGNEKRGLARFHSLLGLFDINERLVSDVDEIDLETSIDYTKVNQKLLELRGKSLSFLTRNLA